MRKTDAIRSVASTCWMLFAVTLSLMMVVAPLAAADEVYFDIDATGLDDLGGGWAYEGWLIVDGSPVSTGTFTVDQAGALSRRTFAVAVDDADGISTFVLTIEPVPDADPAPSAVHILGGDFQGGTAQLSVGHGAALGDDFSSASGPYILNAPSGGEGVDYRNGIWWLDPDGGPGPTLELPTLPEGWAYEGWVVGPGGPLSTGRFTMASGHDSDAGGLTSGPFGTPPFPGQDLLNPPMVLTDGYAAVISIEPEPDNGPGPFTLKPLVDGNIDDVGAGVPQDMANNAAGFPSAMVSLHDSAVMDSVAQLGLDLHGLEDLGDDFVYEGWLIVDGAPVSTGTFTVDGGVMSQHHFPTQVSSVNAISTFVLTIEPADDSDPAPSAVHLVGGDFTSGQAALTVGHPAALGTDFADVAGGYILAAPSGGGAAPYQNGIWWLDPGAGPGASLTLPDLPEGWVYEGWVAGADGPISTGRFTSTDGEDSDGTGPAAGPESGPPFPGQDFVDPAIDLTAGYAAVISVEPEPDNGAGPFSIKPLMDPNIDDVGAEILQPMHRNGDGIPYGHAALLAEHYIPAAAHTGGTNQSVWRTDLDIHNTGGGSQSVVVELLPSDQANTMPQSVSLMLAPYASVRYRDVIESLFGTEGVGALRILADRDSVRMSSRSYNDEGDGTYGQGIPSEVGADAIGFGEIGRLVGLSDSGDTATGFRTNIGLVNLTAGSMMVSIDLYGGDGELIGTATRTLAAFEQTQVNGIFPEATDVGYAEVWTSTPGGRFLAYGSVVDNSTGDPTYVAAR